MRIVTISTGNYQGCGHKYESALIKACPRIEIIDEVKLKSNGHDAYYSWWDKMFMFDIVRDEKTPILYIDLDTIVNRPLDDLEDCFLHGEPVDDLVMIDDLMFQNRKNSGVMYIPNGEVAGRVFDTWCNHDRPTINGDGDYLNEVWGKNAPSVQDYLPKDAIVSFKGTYGRGVAPRMDPYLICYHGNPRPHVIAEMMRGWN